MKSFIHYITEVATAKHTVGRGNRSGIRIINRVTPSHGAENRETIYHHPHEDGQRYISVTFSSVGPKGQKHHDTETMVTAVHDSKEHFNKWSSPSPVHTQHALNRPVPAIQSKRGGTEPHQQLTHESKKHSILHHRMDNTGASKIKSSTAREYHSDTGELKPGMGRKGSITQRKSERSPHPSGNWPYSNDSKDAIATNAENIQHTWTRKK